MSPKLKQLEIINLSNILISTMVMRKYKSIAIKILKAYKVKDKVVVSFIDEVQMKQLNNKFRKKKKATDVLSFNMNEDGYLGDIIICPIYVKKQIADKNKYDRQIVRLVIHGLLHLLGYDHKNLKQEEAMFSLQEKYLIGGMSNA